MKTAKIENRKRDIVVGFRISKEERDILDNRVRICGYTKQEYLIKSALMQRLLVVGDRKVLNEFREQLNSIEKELKRIASINDFDEVKFESLKTILEIMREINKQ